MFRRSSSRARLEEDRAKPYAKRRNDDDHIESLSKRLVGDLHETIETLRVVPAFTDEWAVQADQVARIATVVATEGDFGRESKDSTLWEGEEVALRTILELGKFNVLVSMLENFKLEQRGVSVNGDQLSDESRTQRAAVKLESGLCTILRTGLRYDEVLQTVDVSKLLEVISDCLRFAVCRPEYLSSRLEDALEARCFGIIESLAVKAEETDNSRALEILRDAEIFPLALRHISANQARLSPEHVLDALRALAAVVATEAFSIDEERYLPTDTDRDLLARLQEPAQACAEASSEARRALRPLLDEIRRQRRDQSSKK